MRVVRIVFARIPSTGTWYAGCIVLRMLHRRFPATWIARGATALAFALSLALPVGADAGWLGNKDNLRSNVPRSQRNAPARSDVPEIDPGTAGRTLALVLGGLAILLDHRRRR